MAVRVRPNYSLNRRVAQVGIFIICLYFIIIGRLVYLQVFRVDYYKGQADKRVKMVPLPAQRGSIITSDQRPYAVTTYTGILVCDPTIMKDRDEAAAVAARLLNMNPADIRPFLDKRLMTVKRKDGAIVQVQDRRVVIRENLPAESVEIFREALAKPKLASQLTGLAIDDQPERTYPAGMDAVHIVGRTIPDPTRQFVGAMGLEFKQDSVLSGSPGSIRAEQDRNGVFIPGTQRTKTDVHNGEDIRLTIDSNIQHIARMELKACCDKYHPVGATAIVMDPKTGAVLAMVSYPEFDPNLPINPHDEAIRNRALMLYEPGSTLKVITASAALQDGIITPSTTFYCSGHLLVGGHTINCVLHGKGEAHGHGVETIREIIRHSCNVGAAQVGERIGLARMKKYLDLFGLMSPTGIQLPADSVGTLGKRKIEKRQEINKVTRVAFGQSVMVTPLALLNAYAAIANHGVLMKPRLIQCYQDQNGNVTQEFKPEVIRTVLDQKTAAYVGDLLQDVVREGTGQTSAISGYTVAGKTGTAQKVVPGEKGYSRSKYIASFVGYLPAKDPKAVILVAVDEPQGSIYGAQVAAPVFKNIGQRLMWYWKVAPDDPASLNIASRLR